MVALVHKGTNAEISLGYFIWVLVVRGSASSLFKSSILSVLLGKNLKLKKPKANFIFNTLPSIVLLLVEKFLFTFATYELATEIRGHLVHFFITFMVVSRCLRSMTRIITKNGKLKKKKKNKATKKALKKDKKAKKEIKGTEQKNE